MPSKLLFLELRQKGVDSLTIENAFEDYLQEEENEYDERAMALAEAEKVLRIAGVSFSSQKQCGFWRINTAKPHCLY